MGLTTKLEPPFRVCLPKKQRVPIVVSVPHCGTSFPDSLRHLYHPEHVQHPDDTDWFVQDLYDFAVEMGMTMITAEYSRYVIDLNRDPDSVPLYDDGRSVTGLVPERTFLKEPLYLDSLPTKEDISWRKEHIYAPYHAKLQELINGLRGDFRHVLLWEAHSIRRLVPTIRKEPFSDMILGDADGCSSASSLSQAAREVLLNSDFDVSYNHPFKGGYITRAFGVPSKGVHALQLEMSKDLYMDEERTVYAPEKANIVRELLQDVFARGLGALNALEAM